jgi:hypothetical protein
MIEFLIWAPEYNNNSGGIIALHKLAQIMADLGESVSIITPKTIENSKAKTISPGQNVPLTGENTMSIYPEIISGNPFGTKYVTRWLLNTPGVCGGDGKYNDTDLIYKYYNYFKAPDESKVKGELRTYDLKLDKFINKNLERKGQCYIVKKGANKVLDKHEVGSICIDQYINDDYLIDIFNRCEYFISYDSMCFHIQQAILCGCIPIVIPDEGISRKDFFEKAPINKFGVAYGFDDIEHAKNTQHLLRDHLIELDKLSIAQVKQYIEDSYKHIKK